MDSTGLFFDSGILRGSLSSLGQYDECLSIKSPIYNDEQIQQIKGKYCLANLILPLPKYGSYNQSDFQNIDSTIPASHQINMGLFVNTLNIMGGTLYSFGICIPNTCRAEDVENVLNKCMFIIPVIISLQ